MQNKMYRLFYDYKDKNDVLEIFFINKKEDKKEQIGDVVYYYSNNDIVKIEILNISNYMKIKTSGMIINPIGDIVDILNSILINNGDKYRLNKNNPSGFKIGHVLEKDDCFYEVDIGKIITVIDDRDIKLDSYVIVGDIGTLLSDKNILTKYKIVTYKDIGINDSEEIAYIEKDKVGKDYFENKGV